MPRPRAMYRSARLTQSGHGQPNFAVMHNQLFNRPFFKEMDPP
jgi:hypothetical protein